VTQGAAINLDQPERDMNRTELTLGQIGAEWRYQPRGEAFAQALLSFLRSVGSPDTLSTYASAVLQLFAWYWQRHGRLVTPDRITRGDAAEYNRYLRTRSEPLTRFWLERDPERRRDLLLYDFVGKNPGANLEQIARQLGVYTPEDRQRLARHLGCLVKRRTLTRSPTVAEYRAQHGGEVVAPPEDIYRYSLPTVETPAGPERASTVAKNLSALSSLWSYMIRSGENLPGSTDPLLRHNIWLDTVKQARAQAPSFQEASRQARKPDLNLFLRLLATTYTRTHGANALEAAKGAFFGRPIPGRKMVVPSFKDLRDRALLLTMAQTGVRAKEIKRLKRSSVSGDPPVMTIIGKRGKKRVIMVPPPALMALRDLSAKLRAMEAQQARYSKTGRAARLLDPDAPLFPAVAYWGANSGQSEAGLTRPGIALLLNRRAADAGIDPSSPEFRKAHPHGMRSFFITYALDTGTPIHRVQAIAGHASIATTGRYAEERRPDKLVADVFTARPAAPQPPLAAPERPAPPGVARIRAETWQPAEEAIAPPAAPRPRPPALRGAEEAAETPAEPELRPVPRRGPGEPAKAPETPAERVPVVRPPSAAEMRTQVAELAERVARWRRKPITEREQKTLQKCLGVSNNALRNLCVIYDVHWGESGNRQVLVSTGGGRQSAKKRAERREELLEEFERNPNGFDEDEDEDEEWEEEWEEEAFDPMEALAEVDAQGMQRIAEIARAGSAELYAEAGTDRLNRIYSGKESGLSWWTGTQGRLKPEMPVMSAMQIGSCTPDKQDVICTGLVKLWQQWFAESPTKSEALVRWLGEALDTAAQLEGEVLRRSGQWVPPDSPWPLTRFEGDRSQPSPRLTFREHLPQEIVAWFKARAGSYRVSGGTPTSWQKKTARPKVIGEQPPEWFTDDDPVYTLPLVERRAMIDWLLALSGHLPVDIEPRFESPGGGMSSRRDIAELLLAICQFDQTIDALRDSAEFGPQYTASLFQKKTVDEMPVAVRRTFQEVQRRGREAMSAATNGRVPDFDLYGLIKSRVKGGKEILEEAKTRKRLATKARLPEGITAPMRIEQPVVETEAEAEYEAAEEARAPKRRLVENPKRRDIWAMNLVGHFFGEAAAQDDALKLVAKCGDVPLRGFRDLFRVQGETIAHAPEFKRMFAEQFGAHSECVARRIARQLWEIKQGRAKPKEAVTKPQHMVTLVEVMRTFKVPCTDAQAFELRQLVPWMDKPEGIYQEYAKVRTAAGSERDELSEVELQERELAEEYQEAIEGAMRAEVFGREYERNPREVPLPTPVHLMLSLL
jgi:integrase